MASQLNVAANQAVLDPLADLLDARVLEDDAAADLCVRDEAVVVDRRERADERVHDTRPLADDGGALDAAVDHLGAFLQDDAALEGAGLVVAAR